MIKPLSLLLFLLLAAPAWATIAFDAASEDETCTDTASCTWTHTPVGTPRGVYCSVAITGTTVDVISGIDYGPTAMTRIARAMDTATEIGQSVAYFLGTPASGAQTVAVTVASGTEVKHAVCITVTAASDTQSAGFCIAEESQANPSCTITGITGASYGLGTLFSGVGTEPQVTAGSGNTMRQQYDAGVQTMHAESSTSEQASGDMTVAFTAGADDAALVAMAIQETGGAPPGNRAVSRVITIQ